jgi:hypothetical protein
MEADSPESVEQITEFAERIAAIDGVTCDPENDLRDALDCYTLDFTIGDRDEYRVWDGDREHRAIHRGSISITAHEDADLLHPKHADPFYLQVGEASIHLPLYQDGVDEWKQFIDTKDRFAIREQSGGLSTATHYPSPHIELTADACSFDEAARVIREAVNAYQQTQDEILANRSDTRIGLDAGRAKRESE